MCNLKMDKTQLSYNFALIHISFKEDYIGSSEGAKMWYVQPKNGQNSSAPQFGTFLSFFPII